MQVDGCRPLQLGEALGGSCSTTKVQLQSDWMLLQVLGRCLMLPPPIKHQPKEVREEGECPQLKASTAVPSCVDDALQPRQSGWSQPL